MSTRPVDQPPTRSGRGSTPWLSRAWVSVVLMPVFLGIGFATGEGLYSLLGYAPGTGDAPGWVVVLVSVATVLVVLIPCIAAVYFGRRAMTDGDRNGRWPVVIGAVVAVGATALTVISEVGDALRG